MYRVRAETLINAPIASAIGLGLTETCDDDPSKNCLSIDQLGQNEFNSRGSPAQEHDASHFREDSVGPNDIDLTPSSRLVEAFFDAQSDRQTLDIEEVMAYQRMRIQEACDDRGMTPRTWTMGHRGGAAIQGALLFVLGQANQQGDSNKEISNLRSIVELEVLPASYNPNEDVLFTFQDGCPSDMLRDAFRVNVDRALCDLCPAAVDFDCTMVPSDPVIVPLDPEDC